MRLKPGPKFWAAFYTRGRLLPAGLAGARRQRRGDAAGGVDGPHARRARSGGAGLGGHGPHPVRACSSSRSAAPSSACSSTSPGRCSAWCSCFCSPSTSRSCRCRTGGDLPAVLQLYRPAAADRLGPHRRAGGDGRFGRPRQPHGHQLDSRQGLRHGRQGRRDSERRRRPRDPARRTSARCFRRRPRIWCAGASG